MPAFDHYRQNLYPALARCVYLLMLTALCSCASVNEEPDEPGESSSWFAWQSAATDARQAPKEPETPTDIEPTVVAFRDYKDPLIGFNRAMFAFNDVTYRYALIPASKGYLKVVPPPVRNGLSNFFYNVKSPIYLVNNALQLKPREAGVNLLRFGINSTVGLLGFFDPAKTWFELDRAENDFETTLSHYGVGYGVYLVLPILGPSDLRNGTASIAEGLLHPVSYLANNPESTAIKGVDYFQQFAPKADLYNTLAEESEDPYIFFRNFYLQGIQRDAAYD
jgi:phospholipid-binding lipoprotein MlaA